VHRVLHAFADPFAFRQALPDIWSGFLINVHMMVIAEALVLVLALLMAIVRGLPGRGAKPFRGLAILYTDFFRGTPLTIVGDPERLATAVDNLLQNAVKFSAGPPAIEVIGDRADGHVRLVVKDHGIGIPAAARSRLFEKFYRVNDPELNNVVGTGIGLYLVRQVVEGHGGSVDVASQPGEGSAFEIDLPYALEGAAAPAQPSLP